MSKQTISNLLITGLFISTCVFAYLHFNNKQIQLPDIEQVVKKYPAVNSFKSSKINRDSLKIFAEMLSADTGVQFFNKKWEQADFLDPVDDGVARDVANGFRSAHPAYLNNGSYFITYDTAAILNYVNNILPRQIKRHRKIAGDSTWQVGFYPMIKLDAETQKYLIDFQVIAAIVPSDGTARGGADYFDTSAINSYNKTIIKPYNFGNLHP